LASSSNQSRKARTGEIARQAAKIAYNNSFLMITLGAVLLLPLALLFRPPRRATPNR